MSRTFIASMIWPGSWMRGCWGRSAVPVHSTSSIENVPPGTFTIDVCSIAPGSVRSAPPARGGASGAVISMPSTS